MLLNLKKSKKYHVNINATVNKNLRQLSQTMAENNANLTFDCKTLRQVAGKSILSFMAKEAV